MFIVGRAVAGFGAAGVLQGALSIINQVVPLEKRFVIPCPANAPLLTVPPNPRDLSQQLQSTMTK